MLKKTKWLTLIPLYLLLCGVAHFSLAQNAEVVDGTLTISRSSKAGSVGLPINVELIHAQQSQETITRALHKDEALSLSLRPGWYQVTCRSTDGKGVQGHSVAIASGQNAKLRCYFKPSNTKKSVAQPSSQPRPIVGGTGNVKKPQAALNSAFLVDSTPEQAEGALGGGSRLHRIGGKARLSRGGHYRAPGRIGVKPAPSYNREGYAHSEENIFRSAVASPLSTFSIDVDSASYANSRRFIEQMNRLPPAGAVRVEEYINYFSYDYAKPEEAEPFSLHTEVSTAPWNPKNRLVHIGLQAPQIPFDKAPPMNLVFLIDVSGSMGRPNKLPLLKRAFSLLVNRLREQDTVSIVVYASREGLVLPATSGDQKSVILGALGRLSSGGSTNGAAGIQLAYAEARKNFIKGGNNRVILATDGDFNVGVSSQAGLVKLVEKERDHGVFLSVLGFGRGNYQDSRMEELSNHGNGFAAYIDTFKEAQKVFVHQLTGTLMTVAKDVKVQVEFNPAKVSSYRLIGYANRRLAAEDFKNDKKDAGDMGSGHSVTALYEIVPAKAGLASDKVAPLRYQSKVPSAGHAGELMSVRVRYKAPSKNTSQLVERVLVDHNTDLAATSNAFRFSAAVAQFAMLLNQSKHKGQASFAGVVDLARAALGADQLGNRAEFVRIVQKALRLSEQQTRLER